MSQMDDKEIDLYPIAEANGNEARQGDPDERDSPWNSDEDSIDFDFYFEIGEWDSDDESVRDNAGEGELWYAKQSKNAAIVAMIENKLFLRAVKTSDTETVKSYLNVSDNCTIVTTSDNNVYDKEHTAEAMDMSPSKESLFEGLYCTTVLNDQRKYRYHEHCYEEIERLPGDVDPTEEPPLKRFKAGVETQLTSKRSITHSIWLEAVTIARHQRHDQVLHILFNDSRFSKGVNEHRPVLLQKAVEKYLAVSFDPVRLSIIEILLKRWGYRHSPPANDLQNATILDIICKVEPPGKKRSYRQLYKLLEILFKYGFDLNGRYENNATLLMLACEKERVDIVRSLLKLTSHGFVLDIDTVDNFGETAFMIAKRNNDSEIVEPLLRLIFTSAVKDKNEDIVKSILKEFFYVPYTFAKTWTSKPRDDNRKGKKLCLNLLKIWREATRIAMQDATEHSNKILTLLLDCGFVLSKENEIGLLHSLTEFGKRADGKRLCLIEILLKSGKVNVNARDEGGRTLLHLTKNDKLASLLIRYGADVNIKDNEGRTPLTRLGCNVSALRTILAEAGTMVDLDAVDYSGRTALMEAAMWEKSDAVELLLNAGASVNLSNHIGFTALHHALYGDISENRDEFPLNHEEFRNMKEIFDIFFDPNKFHKNCNWCRKNTKSNEQRMKIVEMLLRRTDIDVNLLSFEKISAFDIAKCWFPQIPFSIENSLKAKGAALSVFHKIETQPLCDCRLDGRIWLTLQRYVYYGIREYLGGNVKYLDFIEKRLLTFIRTFQRQLASGKDQEDKTALHLVVIYFNQLVKKFHFSDEEIRVGNLGNAIVEQLISIGCSVNTTDIYGSTPLHYAVSGLVKFPILSKLADVTIKYVNGYAAFGKMLQKFFDTPLPDADISDAVKSLYERSEETHFLNVINSKEMELFFQYPYSHDKTFTENREKLSMKKIPELLWKEGNYAVRNPLFNQTTTEVIDLMDAIAKEIERLDPRFEIRHELVGSSNEGTKIDHPDEFDFCFILTKISELCEVFLSPELPTGFLRLKRTLTKGGETKKTDEFDELFRDDGILNTEKLNWQFATMLNNVLAFIECQKNFEWNLQLKRTKMNEEEEWTATPRIDFRFKLTSNIKMTNLRNVTCVRDISVDIVPCVHVDGWWPDEAISNVNEEIKAFGIILVFDRPQNLYPWVPYSESCARISFAKAESDTIKNSCSEAKEAYMIGKTMIEKSDSKSNFTLKNCMLYCIEALTPTFKKASKLGLSLEDMESRFRQMDRQLWLKCLMICHLEFVAQDFCPNYCMQKLISPIGKSYLKQSSLQWSECDPDDFPKLCKKAHTFYRCTLDDISEFRYQLHAPDPLWERFDRDRLIASLCEIAYIGLNDSKYCYKMRKNPTQI